MKTDPLNVLVVLRPSGELPLEWTEAEQIVARQRILSAPAAAMALPAPRWRRRRLLTGGAAALAVAVGGIGVATATGLMPSAFTDEYSQSFLEQPLHGQKGIDPSKAERLASTPGPDGSTFTVMVARGRGTYVCTTSLFEATPISGRGPITFDGGGSVCQTAMENGPYGQAFGGAETNYVPHHNAMMLRVTAGMATSAKVRTVTGQVIPMILAEGWFYGWCPNEPSPARFPTLTGYAADGSVVGTSTVSGVTPYTQSQLDKG